MIFRVTVFGIKTQVIELGFSKSKATSISEYNPWLWACWWWSSREATSLLPH